MNKRTGTSNLFLLRVWMEEAGDDRPEWRGKLQHVISGEVRSFHDCATLEAALHEILEMLEPGIDQENTEGGKYHES